MLPIPISLDSDIERIKAAAGKRAPGFATQLVGSSRTVWMLVRT